MVTTENAFTLLFFIERDGGKLFLRNLRAYFDSILVTHSIESHKMVQIALGNDFIKLFFVVRGVG